VADPLDVCTLEDVKASLGLTDGSFDAELSANITAVSRMLDKKCGAIVQRTLTAEDLSSTWASAAGSYPLASFKFAPVVTVTTLTMYEGITSTVLTEQTPGTAPSNGYRLDRETGAVFRLKAGIPWPFPAYSMLVATYSAGRYATTAAVDDRFARAGVLTVVEQWRANKGMGTVTFGVAGESVISSGATGIPRDAWVLIKDDFRMGAVS